MVTSDSSADLPVLDTKSIGRGEPERAFERDAAERVGFVASESNKSKSWAEFVVSREIFM